MFLRFLPVFRTALAGRGLTSAGAQSIVGGQLTDNDLSCSQINAESRQTYTVMQLAGPGLTAANATVPAAFAPARTGNTNASVNQAAFNWAQLQQAAAATPSPASGLGGLFGALTSRNAGVAGVANASQAAELFGAFTGNAPAAAPSRQSIPVAQSVAATSSMGAQPRKSHLTPIFLSKVCKVSDIQQRSPRLWWPAPSFLPSSQHTERATS